MKNAFVFSRLKLCNFYHVSYNSRNHVHVGINTLFINPFVQDFFEYLLFKRWNETFIFYRCFVERYLFHYKLILVFICHMIIKLDSVCFLFLFVLYSSQCSWSFLWTGQNFMALFYEKSICSKHGVYLKQCEKIWPW